MTNSQRSNSKNLFRALAKQVWKQESLTGDILIPKLKDLQDMAIDTPAEKNVRVLPLDASYSVFISKQTDESNTLTWIFASAGENFENMKIVSWTFSSKSNLPQKVGSEYLLTERDMGQELYAEGAERYFDIVAQHILSTEGEPTQEQLQWMHKLWTEKKAQQTPHPLYPLVKAWIKNKTATHITPERDRKYPVAVLKNPMGSVREITFTENDVGQIFKTPERVEQAQLKMEFDEKSKLPSIMPLEVVQTTDMKKQTRAGAVSHELRLFFEAMMALQPNQHRADLMFRLGDLIDYLYPNGKFHWTNQFSHVERALNLLHSDATIPWIDDTGNLRRWRPVSVRSPVSIAEANRDTPIFFDVSLPPDAQQGHIVHKGIHRLLGMKSAAKWNAYHVVCFLWDKYGTVKGKLVDPTRPVERRNTENRLVDADGKQLVNRNGREIKSVYHPEAVQQLDREDNPDTIKRYPVLSNEDLILACFPNSRDTNSRRLLAKAKEHWEALQDDGYIEIHKERNGWRILPPPEHVNAHRAIRTASRHSRELTDFLGVLGGTLSCIRWYAFVY